MLVLLVTIGCSKRDTLFHAMPSNQTDIRFKNLIKETEDFNVLTYGYLYNGGGIAIGDLNNDGLPDIYFTGNMVGSRLYINKGAWKFEEMAKEAGVFAEGFWNTGVTMADVNGDGYLDIYVCRSAFKDRNARRNLLFINNGPSEDSGKITFTEKASHYGVDDFGYSTQASFFDYDRDGDLDLYLLNHSTQEYAGFSQITASFKKRKSGSYSDKLYRNDNGTFKDVSNEAGLISNVLGFGLGVSLSDINNDGWLDIYVGNDYNEQDYLYLNNQDGTFSEKLETYLGHVSLFSMGTDMADINNDGYTDLITLDMLPESNERQKMVLGADNYDKYNLLVQSGFYNQTMRNMLQLNQNGQHFSEIGQFSGISNTDWSWAPLFADFDNDGFKDLYITNGYKREYINMDFMNFAVQEKLKENRTGTQTAVLDLVEQIPATVQENYIYRNNGNLHFTKMNAPWGMSQKSLSNGAAYADLDNDGDLDLVVNNIDEEAFVYQNQSERLTDNHFLRIQLKGEGKNTFGIGSRVELLLENGQQLVQELVPTRGYQSSMDYTLVFGLGNETQIDSVMVTWPDGKIQTLTQVTSNQTLELRQSQAAAVHIWQENSTPLFQNRTQDSLLPYVHRENSFVDFKREQLLPHLLSTQGPRMAKGDMDNDGLEDLFIGGAKGSSGTLFRQTANGEFIGTNQDLFEKDHLSEDIAALFFDADNDGDLDLYVASGGNAYDTNSPALLDRLYRNNGSGQFTKDVDALPPMTNSSSCVVGSDYDQDGDVDLFVGGRLVPGKYPTSPSSYLLENDGNGNFTDRTAQLAPNLQQAGMITDAIWTDFNGDGHQDLIVVGEWMTIRFFANTDGQLKETTSTMPGMENLYGWWNRIHEMDLDADGNPDYILGNFGLNSQLKANPAEPITLYAKDFDQNGALDPITCSYVMGESYPIFSKDDLLGQLPSLKGKYVNYADYANATITDIFTAEELDGALIFKAKTLETGWLHNQGNGSFQFKKLPKEAQYAPIYGIHSADYNEDGHMDIILAGNFYGTRVKHGRYDANTGVLLIGDGTGNFQALSQGKSGFLLRGEIRDIDELTTKNGEHLFIFTRNNDIPALYEKERHSE